MPIIHFIHPDRRRQTVEAAAGTSVMRAAVMNDVPEIVAECGGAAACATCHAYISPHPGLPPLSSLEDEMLEMTAEPRRPNSRLSCQVSMTDALDGLEVELPATQL